jgi:hypothetical protein
VAKALAELAAAHEEAPRLDGSLREKLDALAEDGMVHRLEDASRAGSLARYRNRQSVYQFSELGYRAFAAVLEQIRETEKLITAASGAYREFDEQAHRESTKAARAEEKLSSGIPAAARGGAAVAGADRRRAAALNRLEELVAGSGRRRTNMTGPCPAQLAE